MNRGLLTGVHDKFQLVFTKIHGLGRRKVKGWTIRTVEPVHRDKHRVVTVIVVVDGPILDIVCHFARREDRLGLLIPLTEKVGCLIHGVQRYEVFRVAHVCLCPTGKVIHSIGLPVAEAIGGCATSCVLRSRGGLRVAVITTY